MKLSKMDTSALANLLKITSKQIFIDTFILTEDDLKVLMENSTKTQELVISNCRIPKLEENFAISKTLKSSLQKLDLYYTLVKDEKEFMTESKARAFLDAISKSGLKNTLKSIHYHIDDYPKDELEDMIRGYNMKIRIMGDLKEPKPLS